MSSFDPERFLIAGEFPTDSLTDVQVKSLVDRKPKHWAEDDARRFLAQLNTELASRWASSALHARPAPAAQKAQAKKLAKTLGAARRALERLSTTQLRQDLEPALLRHERRLAETGAYEKQPGAEEVGPLCVRLHADLAMLERSAALVAENVATAKSAKVAVAKAVLLSDCLVAAHVETFGRAPEYANDSHFMRFAGEVAEFAGLNVKGSAPIKIGRVAIKGAIDRMSSSNPVA
jgi:hypothetical protein